MYDERKVETAIIGGGISGLSCAHHLAEAGKKFLLISPEIGGRILQSKIGEVEYGAYYVNSDYKYVTPFVKKGRKLDIDRMIVSKGKVQYSLWSYRIFKHLGQAIKFTYDLIKFRKHYLAFKKKCENEEQINALKEDSYLWELYNLNAHDYVEIKKFKEFVYDFVAEGIHGTAFAPLHELNAFSFLQFSMPLILNTYEFTLDKKHIIKKFENEIVYDKIIKINSKNGKYVLDTKKGEKIICDNLVVATSPSVSAKLLKIREIKGSVNVHMFHIIGEVKDSWESGEDYLFSESNTMLAIARQIDNSYLFYSLGKNPDFGKYYHKYKIINHKHWNPAFNMKGFITWPNNYSNNMYLIGDHNVCGIEDSFISGIYAANRIIKDGKNG